MPTTYAVLNDDGEYLDAHLEIEGREFVFHSRGGKRGQSGARNLDYGPALRLLLQRIAVSGLSVEGAWVDSDEVLHLPRSARSILHGADLSSPSRDQFRILSRGMQAFGRPPGSPYGGSRVKKIRVSIGGKADLAQVLGVGPATEKSTSRERRSGNALEAITAEHVWEAVQDLTERPASHPAAAAGEFDVIADDGMRLSPYAVIRQATRKALGIELHPDHFSEETANRSYQILESAGFEVVRRGGPSRSFPLPIMDEDREWTEGKPKLVSHLKRERATGLSRAKKQSFLRQHGRLVCEKCGLDPAEAFGPVVGQACIEVHHRLTMISEMGDGARTRLEDLECLCANCHRLVHAQMKLAKDYDAR